MNRLAIAALAALLLPTVVRAGGPAEDATELARKITDEGALNFERKDAVELANSYMDDAQLFLVSKDKDTGQIKVETSQGRSEIQSAYEDLLKGDKTVQAKNHVEYARLIAPDMLLISGTFELGENGGNPLRLPFFQVRVKHGERWLVNSMRVFVVSND